MDDTTFMSVSVRLPAVGKIKYNVPLAPQGGGGSRPLRLYDFRLASASALDHTDMNSLWLCVGRDPVQRFGGAWLLTAAYDVEAWLPASTITEFNHNEGKTYLRLWFVGGKESVMPYDKFKLYVVRVALVTKPDEMFLTLGSAAPPLASLGSAPPAASHVGGAPPFMNPPPKREQWKLYYPPVFAPPAHAQAQAQAQAHPLRHHIRQQQSPPRPASSGGVIFNPWGEQPPVAHMQPPVAPARQPPPPNYPPPPLSAPQAQVHAQASQAAVPSGFSLGGLSSYGIIADSAAGGAMSDEYVPQ